MAKKRAAKRGAARTPPAAPELPRKVSRALPAKHRVFVERYLVHLNATRAYGEAGYTSKNPDVDGPALLGTPRVRAAVDAAMAARSKRTEITQDRVLCEVATLAFSDLRHYAFDAEGYVKLAEGAPDDAMRAVSTIRRRVRRDEDGNETVESEIKLWDKPSAVGMAGKHLGMFIDRSEVTLKLAGLAERLARARERAKGGAK